MSYLKKMLVVDIFMRYNFILRIRIHSKCPLFFRATGNASLFVEMDLFAFVDIIGIRAIGFPVGLTFRSFRITFLRERSSFSLKGNQ